MKDKPNADSGSRSRGSIKVGLTLMLTVTILYFLLWLYSFLPQNVGGRLVSIVLILLGAVN